MSYYHDPGPAHLVTEIELADGETATVDLREAGFPLGWSAILGVGAVVTHRGSNADKPKAVDWLVPAKNGTINRSVAASEKSPVIWLRWATAGGTAKIFIAAAGSIKVSVA